MTPSIRLGLVLGGGAALGAAHAGVLQALDEAGMSFGVVAGTSAGALVGGGYAAGLSGLQLVELVLAARFSSFAQWRPGGQRGLFDTAVMERNIEDLVGPVTIEELDRTEQQVNVGTIRGRSTRCPTINRGTVDGGSPLSGTVSAASESRA